MNIDPASVAHNVALLIAFFAVCWIWARLGRLILGWGAIVLFCAGQYGWALLVVWVWAIAEREHRRLLAEERAAALYDRQLTD